ncbi:hypothetical protein J3E69DRAFT_343365, partial [Trichoderma sp. SZMC 28015]
MPCAAGAVLCSVGERGHCKAQRTISLNLVAPTPNDPPLISRLSTHLPGCWPLIRFFSCMACLRLRQEIGERRPSCMSCARRQGKGGQSQRYCCCRARIVRLFGVYESHRLVDGRIPAARRLFRLLLLFGSFSLSGQRSSTRPPDPSRFQPAILIDRSFLFPSADASSTRICFEKACLGGDHRSRRGPSCEGSSVLIDWRI